MEYLLFDCLTTSENLSNSRKTPRNVEPEEEKPCQNQLLFISLDCGNQSQRKAGIMKCMVVLISCEPTHFWNVGTDCICLMMNKYGTAWVGA